MIKIKKYESGDRQSLNELLEIAQKHLGFDEVFMRRFRLLKGIKEEDMAEWDCYEMIKDQKPIAFYVLRRKIHHKAVIEYFIVHPEFQNQQFGRRLWHHLLLFSEQHGLCHLEIVTNPETQGFFERMGADYIQSVASRIVERRKLSLMAFELSACDAPEDDHGLGRVR